MILIKAWYRNLVTQLRISRTERLTKRAASLSEDTVHDLISLAQQGFVRARATGQSITSIHGELENLLAKPLAVRVSPGTYFVASGNFQNMVTRRAYDFKLRPGEKRSVTFAAACINAERPIPGSSDRFRGVRRVPDPVARFIEAATGSDPMVLQAGIWALTDNYSRAQILSHLVAQDRYGNRRPAVSDEQIMEARRILDGLGLSHRL